MISCNIFLDSLKDFPYLSMVIISEFDDLGSIYINPILYHNKNIKSYIFMQLSNKEVLAIQVS